MINKGRFEQVYISRTSEITVHYLRDVIKRMVNHRAKIIEIVSKPSNASQLRSITKIRNMMDFVKDKPLRSQCNIVLLLENDLNLLLPSSTSRFYPHTNNQVADIISYAKKYLEQK